MSSQRRTVINFMVVALVICAVIALCVAFPYTSDRPITTRLCLVVIAGVVLAVFLRTFNRGFTTLATQRLYVVQGVVVQPRKHIGDTSVFFSDIPAPEGGICSICLCSTNRKDASSNCCHNSFHKKCLQTYWRSIESVKCPNCRFDSSIV